MSGEDAEIKKQLSESDENVTEKIAVEGGDTESIKRGIEAKKEKDKEHAVNDAEDLGNEVKTDDNAPSPT
jgi:hypothetical protein